MGRDPRSYGAGGQPPSRCCIPGPLRRGQSDCHEEPADDQEATLNHWWLAQAHRQHVRTTNLLELTFEEDRSRTKVIPR